MHLEENQTSYHTILNEKKDDRPQNLGNTVGAFVGKPLGNSLGDKVGTKLGI